MIPRATLRQTAVFAALASLAACQDDRPAAGAVPVPSGREVLPIDVITIAPGTAGAAARFRFLVPDLAADDFESSVDDMQALCDGHALRLIGGMVPEPQQIIIALLAAEVPFGQPAPEVVQFFETYRVEDGACVVEPF
jgi:Family of unknown function (DUF6497)